MSIHTLYVQSNAMQVTLGLDVDNGLMILPAGYHGYEKYNQEHAQNSPEDLGPCLMLSLPMLQLQLRTNDYYMGEPDSFELVATRLMRCRDVIEPGYPLRKNQRALLQRYHPFSSNQFQQSAG